MQKKKPNDKSAKLNHSKNYKRYKKTNIYEF